MTVNTVRHINISLSHEELAALRTVKELVKDLSNTMNEYNCLHLIVDMMYGETDYFTLGELDELSESMEKLLNIIEID